jgi:hypothetical protein
MPSTGRKLELKANTSMAQTASQAAVYAKGLNDKHWPLGAQKNLNIKNYKYL